MTNLNKPQKALVIGLGASGKAALHYLNERGWRTSAADTRQNPPALGDAAEWISDGVHFGGLPVDLLDDASLLVMSPGVSPYFGIASEIVKEAEKKSIPVIGEIELFARELARLEAEQGYKPKLIGITGTNGKTTTTLLCAHVLKSAEISVKAAGNVGPNAVEELLRAEEAGELPEAWVLELSSFQLDTTKSLKCCAAAFLNATEDHIDWHGSMQAYVQAKRRIFSEGVFRVLNRDDEESSASSGGLWAGFGSGAPERAGDYGLVESCGRVWLARMQDNGLKLLMPESELLLSGRHNTMNVLASWMLLRSAGLSDEQIRTGASTYKGEPHRVEKIFTFDGVDVVDDSKGTNVGAVEAALKGFSAQGRRVLIVMGGDGKGQDFSPLKDAVGSAAGAVALIGMDKDRIACALEGIEAPVEKFDSLEDAVAWLWSKRTSGDVLLLSPACASWDMFRNYAHRSEVFAASVKKAAGID